MTPPPAPGGWRGGPAAAGLIELGTDFGFYPNLGSIFYADFKISV